MKEDLIKKAQNFLDNSIVFALVRPPGAETQLYQGYSNSPTIEKKQVVLQDWDRNENPIYIGNNENLRVESWPEFQKATTRDDYERAFEECINALRNSNINKVVLSRIKEVETSDLSLILIFERACKRYPNAFVYLVQHPTKGLWLGASPEILLKKEANLFESVSLAGTQEYSGENIYKWGQKEKVEQQFVTSQIKEILEGLGAKIQQIKGPDTTRAGGVVHLKTVFSYSFKGNNQELIESLHPTAAVAGLPRKESIDLISRTESHVRGLYTGYIGVLDSSNADIYVNLRCMQIGEKMLLLYLGGGLTLDSNLDAEWNETEMKAKSILNLLNED